MATWNKLNIDDVKLQTDSIGSSRKSLHIGQWPIVNGGPSGPSGPVVAAIFGGDDKTILDDPVGNSSKLFFHSNNEYFRIKNVTDFTITFPTRGTRSTGGGKKGGSSLLSYNGHSDLYVLQHNYGSPPPAFSLHATDDVSNGALANLGLTGSVPIQYANGDSFRLALAYSTDQYLVIRERYQVYSSTLPSFTLKMRAHFFENPTSVKSRNDLSVIHSPVSYASSWTDGGSITSGLYRYAVSNFMFNTVFPGETFDKVTITRTSGSLVQFTYCILQVGSTTYTYDAVDPLQSIGSQVWTFSPTSSMAFSVASRHKGTSVASRTGGWKLYFENTTTGAGVATFVGGVHSFP